MRYNPFEPEYNRINKNINELNNRKEALINDLNWFDNVNISNLYFELDNKLSIKKNYEKIKIKTNQKIDELSNNIKITEKSVKSNFLVKLFNYREQRNLNKKIEELKQELDKQKKFQQRNLEYLSQTENAIKSYKSNIEKYKRFNKDEIYTTIDRLKREIIQQQTELEIIAKPKFRVDNALSPIIIQINKFEDEIAVANDKIYNAKKFENALDKVDNSYERAKLHVQCEITLGEGNPRKIISQQESIVRQLQRDLEKAKKRAIQIAQNASREIKKIVIDGNNMCYEGNKFIGLQPLLTIAFELQNHYEVIVVFDASIRSKLDSDDNKISSKFNSKTKVHIVASKKFADETILNIASDSNTSYVISNDRFGEYKDKEAVKNNRLISHEIVDGKVMVNDLDINKSYIDRN